jgi:hypothetical protein
LATSWFVTLSTGTWGSPCCGWLTESESLFSLELDELKFHEPAPQRSCHRAWRQGAMPQMFRVRSFDESDLAEQLGFTRRHSFILCSQKLTPSRALCFGEIFERALRSQERAGSREELVSNSRHKTVRHLRNKTNSLQYSRRIASRVICCTRTESQFEFHCASLEAHSKGKPFIGHSAIPL